MRRILLVAVAVATLTVVAPASTAYAYNTLGCQFTTANLKWQDATTRASYATPAQAAITAWFVTPTPIILTKVTAGANIRVADGNFGATWNGLQFVGITRDSSLRNPVTYSCSDGTWDTTIVTWWNRYYADPDSAAKRQAIMVHELGHAFGLAHTVGSSCQNVAIMDVNINTWYDTCGFNTPRQDDINGINALY